MTKPTFVGRLLAVSAFSLPLLVAAQPPPVTAPAPPDSLFYVTTAAPVRLDVLGAEGVVPGGVVKDKPYSADSITESTQVLADGNRITHKNQARVYRDSQGRTRREQTMGSLGVFQGPSAPITTITINDPVAGTTYFLDPAAHTARKLQQFRLELDRARRDHEDGGGGGGVATFELAVPPPGDGPSVAVATAGALPLPFPPPPAALEPGTPAAGAVEIRGVARADTAFGPAGLTGADRANLELELEARKQELDRSRVRYGNDHPDVRRLQRIVDSLTSVIANTPISTRPKVLTGPPDNPPATIAARALGPSESTTEDLGEQVLEGVLAHGTRETSTIPAGTLGNERAIVITAERWYSADIDAVVSSKTSDPRFGETSYKLVNVVREEPAPDLFTIPPGYELQADAGFSHAGARALAPGDAPAGMRAQRVFVVEPSAQPDK
jgi:hypothetical protein